MAQAKKFADANHLTKMPDWVTNGPVIFKGDPFPTMSCQSLSIPEVMHDPNNNSAKTYKVIQSLTLTLKYLRASRAWHFW